MMRTLSIRSKLLAMMLLSGILCLAVGGLVADRGGGAALQAAITDHLTSLRENKRAQIEDYLNTALRSARLLSQTPTALRAMTEFSAAFQRMDSIEEKPSPELIAFYRNDFLPGLARMSDGVPSIESYLPAGNAARQLQTDYIARNPHPVQDKEQFVAAPGDTAYNMLHAQLHPFFLAALRHVRFDDILLIDAHSADVVYSVIKQPDFATNLRTGPYTHTGLSRVFERALEARDVGAVVFEPFSAYAPAMLAPTAFLGAPIQRNGATVGVIVVQLSIEEIDRVMTTDHRWADIGLGKTGSAYLVGTDRRARSDDRYMFENKPAFLKSLAAAGVDRATIARIETFNTMVLSLPIDTVASRAALRGESGTGIIRDYRNELVLSSWAPIKVGGIHWAVIAEMDTDEAFAPQGEFRHTLLLMAAVAAIVLTLVSLLWANAFVRPIREIMAGVQRLGAGDDAARIAVNGHDEFSELARAFNTMAGELALRNARIREKAAEHEELLKNIYPEVVAERIKLGQTAIAEAVRNVSILVLNIGGVSALYDSKQHATVALMNEIIDAFDEAAERFGIEKLKTLGESYFAASGLTTPRLDHAARAVAFAAEACRILDRLRRKWGLPLNLGVGIASGDIEAGLIGRQRTVYDVLGTTMVIARRIAQEAGPNAIRVSFATYEMLGDTAGFEPRPPIVASSVGAIATYERQALSRLPQEA